MFDAAHLDLLLVNPGNSTQNYQSLGASLAAVEPPVWAGLIATFVRGHGFSVSILDANAEGLGAEEAAERISGASPRLTAVIVYGHNPSASTQVMPAAGAICAAVKRKRPEMKIILAGGHIAALPERTLREEAADFVCDGEGPYTILELLRGLVSGDSPDYGKVRGLWYRDGEVLHRTSPAPLVRDLDREMPGIAWDLLSMDKYRAHNWHCFGQPSREPYAAIYTTLGCPYHCTFCCIQAPFKSGEKGGDHKVGVNTYRLWGPQTVIRQIDILVREYGVRNIKFADELFVLNMRHVEEICDLIIERGYDLNIWAYARVDTLRKEMLAKLRHAGFTWLALGIEAANDHVRDDAQKGYPRNRLRLAVNEARETGIRIIGNYIFGLPEDNLSTMQETLDLALDLNCEFVNFNCAMAYPGSQLYQTALKEGWELPGDWSGYSQYSMNSLPLRTRYLSAAEVLRFRDHAFQVYFSNPGYQNLILRKFGPDALESVQNMMKHKIRRKNA